MRWEGGRDRKGLGRENKHFTLFRLVEIPLDIQVEVKVGQEYTSLEVRAGG